jgi:small-conductance mechanosensitive channel
MRYETYVSIAQIPTPTPSPGASGTLACDKSDDMCRWILDKTDSTLLASGSYYGLVKPLRILLIIVIALAARYAMHRLINRLVRRTAEGSVPAILRPLKDRLPTGLQSATTIFSERRRQRAEAIGSALRSTTTALIYSIAALMILSELGVDLAPLLASAGIAGVALGFGAQSLVKDLIAGVFMLLEDQYGVGDVVDLGQVTGTVEAVGLRITTIRDARGGVWYIRNGEIVRVGNKSQGWAMTFVDIPISFAGVEEATAALRRAASAMAEDPQWAPDLLEGPEVLGVEQIAVDGAVLRTEVKTDPDAQCRVARELRRRLTEALAEAGMQTPVSPGQIPLRPAAPARNGTGDGSGSRAGTGTGDRDRRRRGASARATRVRWRQPPDEPPPGD